MAEPRVLAGAKILIVEDEYLVAAELKAILSGLGAEVVGPVSRLQPARELARSQRLDGAVLDVKLDGDTSFPLAEDLLVRGVPILFMTGFDRSIIPELFGSAPCLPKPVNSAALQRLALARFGK
jgi:DNA-binding response OmpR family regulator